MRKPWAGAGAGAAAPLPAANNAGASLLGLGGQAAAAGNGAPTSPGAGSVGASAGASPGAASGAAASSAASAANTLSAGGQGTGTAAKSTAAYLAAYAKVPAGYELNVGQTDASVRYLDRSAGMGVFLTDTQAVFSVARAGAGPSAAPTSDVFRMTFGTAGATPVPIGTGELTTRSNYFVGSDPGKWHADVPQFAGVEYRGVAPGVDLVFHTAAADQRSFEYDFHVAPGADASAARVTWQGLQSTEVDAQGRLLLHTAGGTVVEDAPVAYQMVNGAKQTVAGRHVLLGNNEVGFSFDTYDHSRELVIDPTVSFATYLGGSGDDRAFGVAVDGAGNTYVTGVTSSATFPVTSGTVSTGMDAFVSKLNAAGTALVYSTYLGGSGSMQQQGNGIAVDAAGSAYVTGMTQSNNFPTTAGAYQTARSGLYSSNAFVTKLSATGDALAYSTYLGGSDTRGNAIAVGTDGSAYLTGQTGTTFPTTTGVFGGLGSTGSGAFATRLNASGSALVWSGVLAGGSTAAGYGIAAGADGSAYVTGKAEASGLPTTTGAYQTAAAGGAAFVTKVKADGSALVYSTYLGTGGDVSTAIAVGGDGTAYVAGQTAGSSFPTTSGAFQTSSGGGTDAFVTRLNAAGSALVYSTYAGGAGDDGASGIGVDVAGNATVAGSTASTNFPTLAGAFQASNGGTSGSDAFVLRLTPTGAGNYSSYLGGSGDDAATGVALDALGNAYLAGLTNSTNFPVTGGAYQSSNAGGYDAFVAKVLPTPIPPKLTAVSPDTGASAADQVTSSQNLTLSGTAVPTATVTLYREGVGLLGSVVASAGGTFAYDYTATTLAEGTYDFNATDSTANGTSSRSADFLVTIDRTAPAVAVSVPASTTSRGPVVRVTASDLNGLPNGTTVTLDVDLNNDGNFTDAGEAGYASGTLTNGAADVKLPTLAGTGTYAVRASVTDLAGNVGTSAAQSFTVTTVPGPWTATAQVLTADPEQGDRTLTLGNVSTSHLLNLDASGGGQSGVALVYNSDTVSVRPIVQVSIPTDNSAALPSTITARLTFNGVAAATMTYSTTGLAPGDPLIFSLQAPNVIGTTGRYAYSVLVQIPGQTDQNVTGSTFVVSLDGGVMGSGWSVSGVDRLIDVPADSTGPAGKLRVYGSDGYRFYQGTSTFTSPVGDNGTLSVSGGTYTYTSPDGETLTFNSGGYQTKWLSADGHQEIDYAYDGSHDLTGITAIDGTATTIAYSSGLAQTFTTFDGRVTTLGYTGTNLTLITNPDGGLHTLAYDGSHRLTDEQLDGLEQSWIYGTAGGESSETLGGSGSPSTTLLAPANTWGLGALAAGVAYATLTDANGNKVKENFDPAGRALLWKGPDGTTRQWAYANGYVTQFTDQLGRPTTYTRDTAGYVTQETLPDGNTRKYGYQAAFHALTTFTNERNNVTTYAYDTGGHLTGMTDALSNHTTWAYNTSGLLTNYTDADGNLTTYVYDTYRRLTQTIDALGNTTTNAYDANGFLATVTDALGRVTTYSNDVMGRALVMTDAYGNAATSTYSKVGQALTSTDALGNLASMAYDAFKRGWLGTSWAGVGSGTPVNAGSTYDPAGTQTGTRDAAGSWWQSVVDALGRVMQTTDPTGGKELAVYDKAGEVTSTRDALGRRTTSAYNLRGWLTSVTDAQGNVTTYAYDAVGNVVNVIDPLGHTTTNTYDALDRLTNTQTALGFLTTTTFDPMGHVLSQTDQRGTLTTYAYDKLNRQVAMTEAAGTGVARTTTTVYDKVGNVVNVIDGLGRTVTWAYDKLNRLTVYTDTLGHVTTTAYDKASNAVSVTDALGKITSSVYDALNRPYATTDALGHATTSVLDARGATVGSIDALGNFQQWLTDAAGRALGSWDARGALTLTNYDVAGEVRSVTDAAGNLTSYVYDSLGRELTRTDTTGQSTTSAYDAASRLTSRTDRNGKRIDYRYDNDNRLIGATWFSAAGATLSVITYTLDANGNQLTAQDAEGTITRTFDPLNRVSTKQDVFGVTLTYTYDAGDRLTQRADSLGGVLTSVYDNADRLTSRKFNGTGLTPLLATFTWSNRNELTGVSRYSDLAGTTLVGSTSYVLDDSSRLTSITNKNATGTTLSLYTYAYDSADRVTGETWQAATSATITLSGSRAYTYDATNQLLSDGVSTYGYDLNGNRNTAGYSTGQANRTTTYGTWTYSYDYEGNVTQKTKGSGLETWYYGYDSLNHLVSLRQTSDGTTNLLTIAYTYDAEGMRVQQDKWTSGTGTVTTRFVYDDNGMLVAELNASNAVQVYYVYAPGDSTLLAREDSSGVSWVMTDRLGSTRDVVQAGTWVLDHVDYSGFGVIAAESNSAYGGSVLYAGMRYDRDTGLSHTPNREYAAATGQWMQEDPISFGGGDGSLRRYVGNDATNVVDPSGLEGVSDWLFGKREHAPGPEAWMGMMAAGVPQQMPPPEPGVLEKAAWQAFVGLMNAELTRRAHLSRTG